MAANKLDSSMLEDDAVTDAKLATGAVTNTKLATGIDATKLADGTITNSELQYINSLSSNAQTQIDGAGGQYAHVTQTYDMAVTGTFSITGLAFTPKMINIIYSSGQWVIGRCGVSSGVSSGNAGSINAGDAQSGGENYWFQAAHMAEIVHSYNNYAYLFISSLDAAGVTFNRTKYGSPTGTVTLFVSCFG
jgi:hypothetical protein